MLNQILNFTIKPKVGFHLLRLLIFFALLVNFESTAQDYDYDQSNGIKFTPPSDFSISSKLSWVNNKTGETLRIVSSKIPEKFYRKDFYDKVISYDNDFVKNTICFDYEGDDWKFKKYFEFELSEKKIHSSLFLSNQFDNNGKVKMVYASVKEDILFMFFIEGNCLDSNGNLSKESVDDNIKRLGFIFGNTHIPLL